MQQASFSDKVDKIPPWHNLDVQEVMHFLATTSEGLNLQEVQRRQEVYGLNKLHKAHQRSVWKMFFSQFNNVLIYLLLAATIIAALLQHWVDASVICGVIILDTLIGFIQERKSEQALQAIKKMLAHRTTVIRNGQRMTIRTKYLVPGDIVLLQSGDKVPADLRLFNVKALQIQESMLTGESMPANKAEYVVSENAALGDRVSMAYSGTLVVYGRGQGVVVATGSGTELGNISKLISHIPSFRTPLLQQIDFFARWLTLAILSVSAITYAIGALVWGDTSVSLFLAVISLAVAAIPEGLPAIMTITLAMGVTRMAKRNAIVRNLPAVEITGSITTICTDKTGTLTHNELVVRRVVMAEHDYHVTGSGYTDKGEIHLSDAVFPLEEHVDLSYLIRAGILCNDAELLPAGQGWKLQGNPLDGAFLSLGLKLKMDVSFTKKNYPTIDFIPFESRRKIMASLHHDHQGVHYFFIKGAPEIILARSKYERFHQEDRPINLNYWENVIRVLAEQGQRLVAIAIKETREAQHELNFNDLAENLVFLGIVGLVDPPRDEAINAVAKCQVAGICVKMITGDHVLTALAIAKQVGIKNCQTAITGEEIDKISDESLAQMAKTIDVYARTSPEHKLRLVRALQHNGEIVAMTGDGVNDAPALKQADIGIAMGKKGSEAAKEVSDIVLADDNFASIAHAVEEGRSIYDNLKKALIFMLPTNGGEAFTIVMAITLGYILPITATQILWLNMVTAVTLGLSFAFEPTEENIMRQSPRIPKEPILSRRMIVRIVFVFCLMTLCALTVFSYERSIHADLMEARCAVVNMLVAAECAYIFSCRKLHMVIFSFKAIMRSKAVFVAVALVLLLQLIFTYFPSMEHFFGVKPISIGAWIRIGLLAAGFFVVVEIEKILTNFKDYRREKMFKGAKSTT